MLVLAKEMLSQREAEPSIARPGEPPPPPPPLKNIQLVTSLAHHHARLLVVDESHNLNKRNVTKQELNLYAEPIRGIPKLLLTGTPGTTAGEVFRLLQIVRHKSLLQTTKKKTLSRAGAAAAAAGVQLAATIMVEERQWRQKFFEPIAKPAAAAAAAATKPAETDGNTVRTAQVDALSNILKSCFLYSPNSVAPARIITSVEKVEPLPVEVESYNFALSLHQRDVLRATPGRKQPDEWVVTRPSTDWYPEKKKDQLPKPSGEKTIGDLMRAANGGECWSLTCYDKSSAPPGILKALAKSSDPTVALPVCVACGVAVAGLLTLPCRCPGEVCGECFVQYRCDRFQRKGKTNRDKCPVGNGCKKKQMKQSDWVVMQPQLNLQADETRRKALEKKQSKAVQREEWKKAVMEHKKREQQSREAGDAAPAPRPRATQPAARSFAPLCADPALLTVSDAQIEKAANEWGIGAGAKLIYLAQRLRELSKDGKAKVLLTPPSNTVVRARFVEALRALIGRDAVADLNVKLADSGKELANFKRGFSRYWRCMKCGEEHEESVVKCSIGTCCIKLETDDDDDDDEQVVVRHVLDVAKVDGKGNAIGDLPVVGNKVVVYDTKAEAIGKKNVVARGTVLSTGTCNGKRPADDGEFRQAPQNSCFVLILNPKSMEGTDLPMGTHLFQFEPILREDIEKQAHARALRLGSAEGNRPFEIVQLLMKDTIEDHLHNDLKELRARAAGKKKADKAEYAGKTVTMLHALKLLRPDPSGQEESADEGEEQGEQDEAVKGEEEAASVDKETEDSAMEDAEVDANEEQAAVKLELPGTSGKGRKQRRAEDLAVHDGPVPQDVIDARNVLLTLEDRVKFDHVSDSFLGNRDQRLREWRIKVQNVRAVTEVAGLMRELREGMLDQLMGQVLFKAGWTTDGDRYKVWYSAAQAPNLSAERLLKLLGELKASRSAEDMPALPHLLPSLAAGSSSEVVRPSRSAASCSAGSSAPIAGTCSSAPAPTAEPPPKRQKHAEDGMPSMADIMAHLRREFPGAPRDASDLLAYLSSEFTSPPDGLGNIKSKLFYFYEQTK